MRRHQQASIVHFRPTILLCFNTATFNHLFLSTNNTRLRSTFSSFDFFNPSLRSNKKTSQGTKLKLIKRKRKKHPAAVEHKAPRRYSILRADHRWPEEAITADRNPFQLVIGWLLSGHIHKYRCSALECYNNHLDSLGFLVELNALFFSCLSGCCHPASIERNTCFFKTGRICTHLIIVNTLPATERR